ncbi:uncharacterized protein NDAI_0C04650 [Naumovozyma dairenensis CBS 421]|uniref:Uncharacterized protein n=1 Tax=Naumovozyma dairenensis (strain ATCC 10597 / BCRC 20456 / CBS 421 / NBRC 0211 / NRRL Y-12639) TaxID=1071378 RepID=G0W8L3_NAUDC|nr:hypothetical protein NDAI_0C04650 [Naumovozyma dairenensis CBS 421]CCD24124.1 hypothetical protein NDAI_0C04650 [Naumovozyma dairenensis CBS 421]
MSAPQIFTKLDTLKEEDSSNLTSPIEPTATTLNSPSLPSKPLNLGRIGKNRPSDSVLLLSSSKIGARTNVTAAAAAAAAVTVPRHDHDYHNPRPISEESILTRTTDIFSSDTNSESFSSISNELENTTYDDQSMDNIDMHVVNQLEATINNMEFLSINNDNGDKSMDMDMNMDMDLSFGTQSFSTIGPISRNSTIRQQSSLIHENTRYSYKSNITSRQNSINSKYSTTSSASASASASTSTSASAFAFALPSSAPTAANLPKACNRSNSYSQASQTKFQNNRNKNNNRKKSNSNNNNNNNNNTVKTLYPLKHSHSMIINNSLPMYDNNIDNTTNKSSFMTPSQKFRLRKEQKGKELRKIIKEKEQFYEESEKISDLEIIDGDINDSLIWNIPTASISTTSFISDNNNNKNKTRAKKNLNRPLMHSQFSLSTTSIPGINSVSDTQYFQETTNDLSSLYVNDSKTITKSKLQKRHYSADHLPLSMKHASDSGLEDLLLVSNDKLKFISSSRPSWLPPKDPIEMTFHNLCISENLNRLSNDQLKLNQANDELLKIDQLNISTYERLLKNDNYNHHHHHHHHHHDLKTLKKIIWQTKLPNNLITNLFLMTFKNVEEEHSFDSFENVLRLLNKMKFPTDKEFQINQLIENNINNKLSGYIQPISDQLHSNLMLLLQLKSISQHGLVIGDDLLFYHFLLLIHNNNNDDGQEQELDVNDLSTIWNIVNKIQVTCFNEHYKEQYDINVLKKAQSLSFLNKPEFKNELNSNCLNFNTIWNVFERLDHDLFLWIISIIFTLTMYQNLKSKRKSNYKISISFTINILINYHFGFNDFQHLNDLEDANFCIPMPIPITRDSNDEQLNSNRTFIKKWLHYYETI